MSKQKTIFFIITCLSIAIFFSGRKITTNTPHKSVHLEGSDLPIDTSSTDTVNFKLSEKEMGEVMLIYIYRYGDSLMKKVNAEDISTFYKYSDVEKVERVDVSMYILCLYIEKYGYGIIKNYIESKTKSEPKTFNKHEVKDSACTDKPRDWTSTTECPEDSGINN